ncbi:MAG: hypothetical protein ACE5HT_02790 [Gemmatimonadales bacterium]
MKHVLAGLIFLGFVMVGLVFARRGSMHLAERNRKFGVNVFLVYLLLASFSAGILQKNAWPFADWPLIAGKIPEDISQYRIMVVDSTDREFDIDYRAWEPLVFRDFAQWFVVKAPKLAASERAKASQYLLDRLEVARIRSKKGERVGTVIRVLGPFSAPYFLLEPKIWSDPDSVPRHQLIGLRVYFYEWNLLDRARDPSAFRRSLFYEFRRPS